MTWDLNSDGNVTFAPVAGYTIAMFYDQAIGLRVEFARTPDALSSGQTEAEQFILSPAQAMEIGKALMERAELAMRPTGSPQA